MDRTETQQEVGSQYDLPTAPPLLHTLDTMIVRLRAETRDSMMPIYRSTVIHQTIDRLANEMGRLSEEDWLKIHDRYLRYRQDPGRMSVVLRNGDFDALKRIREFIESKPELWEQIRSKRRGNLGKRTLVTYAIIHEGIKQECGISL